MEINCFHHVKVERKEKMSIYWRCLNPWKVVEYPPGRWSNARHVCVEHARDDWTEPFDIQGTGVVTDNGLKLVYFTDKEGRRFISKKNNRVYLTQGEVDELMAKICCKGN